MENMDKGLTNKMDADSLSKMPQNLSSQANNSGFQWKKASLAVRSPWFTESNNQSGLSNFVHQKY